MENMEDRILTAVKRHSETLLKKNVVIYGCTFFTKRLCMALQQNGIRAGAIVDNDEKKAGKQYLGISIFLPRQYLLPYKTQTMVVVCSVHEKEMIQSLYEMGYGDSDILHISSEMDIYADTLEYAQRQMETVRRGVKYYQKIEKEFGEDTKILVGPRASGDIYIACSYLQAWCLKQDIRNYVLLGLGKNVKDIAAMFGIEEKVRMISEDELDDLMAAYMFLGDSMNVKFISEWTLTIRNSYFPRCQSSVVFRDKFKLETFQLTENTSPQYPPHDRTVLDFVHRGLPKDKTVIMAPYAYSSPAPMISPDIWAEIAEALSMKGYAVYTIGYGEKEPAVKGTCRIQFSYKEARSILEYAGNFLSARSGLCDIVHMAECRQLVIYGRNIRNDNSAAFFSLRRNYPDFRGQEIVFDDFGRQDFIEYVAGYFER